MILVEDDCILWDAVDVLDGRTGAPTSIALRRFLVFARRPSYQGKLYEEVDGALVFVADLPGLKEGSAKIVPGINSLDVYCSSRENPDGDFKLCKHTFDVAGVYPLDLIGAARLRSVCRNIIKAIVPAAFLTAIEPYCK